MESNGSCDCVTTYADEMLVGDDAATASRDKPTSTEEEEAPLLPPPAIIAGPSGRRLTLMLNRRMKPRREMVASLLDHEICTHALRFSNEWVQPWAASESNRGRRSEFGLGLTTSRSVAATEEGLASINGLLNKPAHKRSLVFPALLYGEASFCVAFIDDRWPSFGISALLSFVVTNSPCIDCLHAFSEQSLRPRERGARSMSCLITSANLWKRKRCDLGFAGKRKRAVGMNSKR